MLVSSLRSDGDFSSAALMRTNTYKNLNFVTELPPYIIYLATKHSRIQLSQA